MSRDQLEETTVLYHRIALAIGLSWLLSSTVFGQINSRSAISSLQSNRPSIRNQLLNRPTVSPYLRLLQGDGGVTSGFGGGESDLSDPGPATN